MERREEEPAGRVATSSAIETLGYRFHPLRKPELLDLISEPRAGREKLLLASANLHGLYMFETVPEYRALLERPSTSVIIDGMPVVWLLKALGHRVEAAHRTTWVDWFPEALERAARQKRRIYVLGYREAVLERGLRRARTLWPGIKIAGSHGFFDLDDESGCRAVVEAVNRARPDLLFVGMGMPRQEIFVERYGAAIDAPVIGLAGAAFAYFAGDQKVPPRWMGKAGLEWLHRLADDPRRLAGRYLLEPALLLFMLARRLRKSPAARAGPTRLLRPLWSQGKARPLSPMGRRGCWSDQGPADGPGACSISSAILIMAFSNVMVGTSPAMTAFRPQ